MSEQTNIVRTELTLVDKATPGLNSFSKIADKANNSLGGMAGSFSKILGFGAMGLGALSFGGMVNTAQHYLGTVKRIGDLTGLSAEKTDSMMDAMSKYGVSAEEAEGILGRLSKKGALLGQQSMFGGAGQGMGGMSRMMKQMGIDIKNGPEKALISASIAAQKGTLDTAQLGRAFGVSTKSAGKLMELLRKGPENIKEMERELRASGTIVTTQDVASFKEMEQSQREIADAWERIQIVVGKTIVPAVAKLLKEVEKELPTWIGYAKKFGEFLNKNLSNGLVIAKALGKVLLANFAIQRATSMMGTNGGQGVGITGAAKAAPGWLKSTFFAGGFTKTASRTALNQVYAESPGLMTAKVAAGYGAAPGMMDKIGMFTPLMKGIAGMTGAAMSLYVIVGSVTALLKNTMGIADYLSDIFTVVLQRVGLINNTLAELDDVDADESPILWFFKNLPVLTLKGLGTVLDLWSQFWLVFGKTAAFFVHEFTTNLFTESPAEMLAKTAKYASAAWDLESAKLDAITRKREQEELDRLSGKVDSKRPERGGFNNHFYNPKFDITQNFAEGYDPDRIAVAFTKDLGAMADRRLRASTAPVFSST